MTISLLIFGSCSKGISPIEPPVNSGLPDSKGELTGNREAIAVYDAVIDPAAEAFTIKPSEREASFHYPLSNVYPATMQIIATGWTPTFWADIKISHPFPGSGVVVFDPRIIAILPANPGVSFNYPVNGVTGNNSVVYQPDGYTKLFDSLGGSIPGNVNPFKAYMKSMPYRAWLSTGSKVTETQRWYMNLAGFGGPQIFKLVLDVSTNYPNPPHQVTDNAPEPVQITTTVDPGLTSMGGSANVWVNIIRWQGDYHMGNLSLEAPDIFNGTVGCTYQGTGPNAWNVSYWGVINNTKIAPAGTYKILTAGSDLTTGITMYVESTYVVAPPDPSNPVDRTAWKLNFSPEEAVVANDTLWMAAGVNGLHAFNVYEHGYAGWSNNTWLPDSNIVSLDWANNYAYALDAATNQLVVVTAETPNYMLAVKRLDLPGTPYDIDISGAYAFIACGDAGLQIVSIVNPENPIIYKSVDTPGSARGVYRTGDYVYIGDYSGGLQIVYTNPIENSFVIDDVATSGFATKICALGDYVYVADGMTGLQVIRVNPPTQTGIVKTLALSGPAMDVLIVGTYLYVVNDYYTIQVVDISTPSNAFVYKTLKTDFYGMSMALNEDVLYVLDRNAGFDIINVSTPGNPSLIREYRTPSGVRDVQVVGYDIYMACNTQGMQIFNFWQLYSYQSVVYPGLNTMGLDVQGDYVYAGCEWDGLSIIHANPISSAHVEKMIDTPGGATREVDVSGDYAYVADGGLGLQIIKINPPDTAYIVKTVDTPVSATDVCVSGNYAYVSDHTSGLQIININPPASASIVKTVDTPGQAMGVTYANGYAYVGDYTEGLQIIDVDPVGNASIVKSVDTPGTANGVFIKSDYVYIADGTSGLQIVKINPVNSAYIYEFCDTPGYAYDVWVDGEYAWIADGLGGLRMIDLWYS